MRLAVVHYHLKRGGVTRVIASALESLGGACDKAVVIAATQPEETLPCPVAVVPELAYTEEASPSAAKRLNKAMQAAARPHLGGDPDMWHMHNHCLGKNVNFPEALRLLLKDGATRVLLQIHDFAEDGRPGNYRRQKDPYERGLFADYATSLFPVAPQIGYAVLNGRDHEILRGAGIPESSLFWLPNAVTGGIDEGAPDSPARTPPLMLYPTRGIRRKNLGELLLMSRVYPDFQYATTLTPDNPQWRPTHDRWVELAGELGLPVSFGLGERPGASFGELVKAAHSLVTTSVAEGFGLAFLEPWLFGKAVRGRDLPEITTDFKKNGIQLKDLYESWPIPCRLFNENALRERFLRAARSGYAAYGKAVTDTRLLEAWRDLTADGSLDFGGMDEEAQTEVLRSLDPSRSGAPSFPAAVGGGTDPDLVKENTQRIRESYGLASYGRSLMEIYTTLREASAEVPRAASTDFILKAFLDPRRLRLLRT